ncbi:MAG: Glu/Leu/Phe/Val dehydrogenase, partial [Desulfobacca sp.]
LNVAHLLAINERQGKVLEYPQAKAIAPADLFALPCDILVPAARPDVITMANAPQIQAKMILQGANIPVAEAAERYLHDRGILSLPDFIVNAGGVITTSIEYRRGSVAEAFATIQEKIKENCQAVLRLMREQHLYPREAALQLAQARVREGMSYRRHF